MALRLFILLFIILTVFSSDIKAVNRYLVSGNSVVNHAEEQIRQFTIVENDTLRYTLKLVLDSSGKPQYFFRNIFTPVCYTNECKPVYINFYWDLLGNYLRYDMPKGKILTKVDHDEFEEKDYQKLADILSRPNSIFADLKMEDLLTNGTDSLTSDVDAKTGATLKTIKNDVIDGAVYTCFTLWHIAYGKQVIQEMNKITNSYLDEPLLHSFLASNNYHYQYRAMEAVMSATGIVNKAFEKDIENVISGKNLFTARTALQKTSTEFFKSVTRQNWLWKTSITTSYPMQVAILKKLATFPVQSSVLQQIVSGLAQSNSEQFKLKMAILSNQKSLPDPVINDLAVFLKNEQYAPEIYKLLKKTNPINPTVTAELKQFENDLSN